MIEFLPTLNAFLNSTSAVLLVIGYRFIKKGNKLAHKKCMIGTFTVSVLFLISYLTYHSFHGTTRFTGEGWIRPVYFIILTSHTILAAAIVPLAIITLRRGLPLGRLGGSSLKLGGSSTPDQERSAVELLPRSTIDKHVRIARWTYPIWLYVSITGVVIYLILYHFYPPN